LNKNWPKTIPLEDIRQLVQERLTLPKHWKTHTARLETWAYGKKIWKLEWKTREKDREVHFWVNADAASGEILDLDQGIPAAIKFKRQKCSREEAITIAQKFLEQVYPDKAQQVEPYAVDTQTDCYRLRYRRLANGVPFDPDEFEIEVEPLARQVRDAHLTWSDIHFAPLDRVINAAEAEQYFLARFPLQLGYYVPVELALESMGLNEREELEVKLSPYLPNHGNAQQARLIYAPAYTSFYSTEPYFQIDALTGCLIDNFGTTMDATAIQSSLLRPDIGAPPLLLSSSGLSRAVALRRAGEIMDWLTGAYEVVQVKKITRNFGDGPSELWELRCVAEAGEAQIRLDSDNGEVCLINSVFNDAPKGAAGPSSDKMEADAIQNELTRDNLLGITWLIFAGISLQN